MNGSFLHPGKLEVYVGPMKSGKSMALLQRVEALNYIVGVDFAFFKPDTDTRNPNIFSRFGNKGDEKNNLSCECTFLPADQPEKVFEYYSDNIKLVAFDEAQFFSRNILGVIDELLKRGVNVVVAGLDYDFRGEPFGAMAEVYLRAEYPAKLIAVCEYEQEDGSICGKEAQWTQRLIDGKPAPYDSPIVLVGDVEEGYQARCTAHHQVPGKPKKN